MYIFIAAALYIYMRRIWHILRTRLSLLCVRAVIWYPRNMPAKVCNILNKIHVWVDNRIKTVIKLIKAID